MTTAESSSPFPCDFAARRISRAAPVTGRETPHSSASRTTFERSLYMLLAEKCGEKSRFTMRGPRVSIAPVRAPPTDVISMTVWGSRPAFAAKTSASAEA